MVPPDMLVRYLKIVADSPTPPAHKLLTENEQDLG